MTCAWGGELGRVLQAAEDERTRIAHDLHDGPVQQLAVLNYDVYRARKRIAELLGRVARDGLVGTCSGPTRSRSSRSWTTASASAAPTPEWGQLTSAITSSGMSKLA
jgi:Histidine kinase